MLSFYGLKLTDVGLDGVDLALSVFMTIPSEARDLESTNYVDQRKYIECGNAAVLRPMHVLFTQTFRAKTQ
jgi:hypothetical protein